MREPIIGGIHYLISPYKSPRFITISIDVKESLQFL